MEILSQVNHSFCGLGLPIVSQTAATALISALWQSLAIAVGLAIALKLVPGTSANSRFTLWGVAFLASISLPFLPFLANHAAALSPNSTLSAAKAWLSFDSRWSVLAAVLWACASIYKSAELISQAIRLRKLWRTAKPSASENAICLPKSQKMQLCTTDQLERPSVVGFFRPRILIPEWLLEKLTPSELEQILRHESEHLSRWDNWTNLLQKLALVIFPLNPGLWWMERQLCLEREMACDEAVVSQTSSPRAYATCLTDLAERSLYHRGQLAGTLTLGAWQHRSELARRIHRILLRRARLTPAATWSLAVALGAGVVVGSVELSRCPALVAFVQPTSSPLPDSNSMAGNSAEVKNGGLMFNYPPPREVELKAIMPVSRPVAERNRISSRASHALRTMVAPADPARYDDTAAPEIQLAQAHGGQQVQLIVLTTWEQSSVAPARPSQDQTNRSKLLGLDRQPGSSADLAGSDGFARQYRNSVSQIETRAEIQQGSQRLYQTTVTREVTRLIFQVAPGKHDAAGKPDFNPGNSPESDQTTGPGVTPRTNPRIDPGFRLGQTVIATVPLRSGWLIFQL